MSRNVVFEECEEWEWDKQHDSAVTWELEWEDDEQAVTEESLVEEDVANTRSEESLTTNQETPPDPVEGRSRKQPTWLKDYVSGEGLSDEEEAAFFASYTAAADPLNYEEAVKNEKWRNAMDAEIAAIEKNGTWELIDRPKGVKIVGVK